MAKIYGLFGSMTGKLADVVMSVRNGEQIARKYQPVVLNPNTPAQVANRAKMKLMSQLSAIMAPVIAIPREGSKSSRNLFVKKNYRLASYADSQADITLADVQLTDSVVAMPAPTVTRDGAALTLGINQQYSTEFARVVYSVFSVRDNNEVFFENSSVVDTPGADNTFPTSVNLESASYDVVVLAYGVRDNTEAARTIFGDLQGVTAEQIARLIVTRTLTESDVTLSRTAGVYNAASAAKTPDEHDPETASRSSKKK